MHAEWAIRCAEAGKHLLCEKPMTLNEADTMAVVEAARRNDVFLMEAFMYRCHPQTERLVELLRSGVIGDVKLVRATFGFRGAYDPEERAPRQCSRGGGILDLGCYTVSMSRLVAAVALGVEVAEPRRCTRSGTSGLRRAWTSTRRPRCCSTGTSSRRVSCGVRLAMGSEVRVHGTGGHIVVPEPWFCSGREAGRVTSRSTARAGSLSTYPCRPTGGSTPSRPTTLPRTSTAARPASPGMTWEDSLANMRTLDRWRAAIGVEYDAERPESLTAPVHGRPLARRSHARMTYGSVDGVDKPVSRIVMGTLNRHDLRHASVMYDDYFELGGNSFDTARTYGSGRSGGDAGPVAAQPGRPRPGRRHHQGRAYPQLLPGGGDDPACAEPRRARHRLRGRLYAAPRQPGGARGRVR